MEYRLEDKLAVIKYNDDYLDGIVKKIRVDGSKYVIDGTNKMDIMSEYFTFNERTWLVNNNYFTAPAALKHHSNYSGGLFMHSLFVALELQNLTNKLHLRWDREESPFIIGLLHDICKTDDYTMYPNPGSNDYTIESNSNKLYPGHGDKSIIMLSGHIYLTDQEKMCIRYHMGAFTDKSEWGFYSKACNSEPNVLYTHTADMIASQVREI